MSNVKKKMNKNDSKILTHLFRNGSLSRELSSFFIGNFFDVHDRVLGQLARSHQTVERGLEKCGPVDLGH